MSPHPSPGTLYTGPLHPYLEDGFIEYIRKTIHSQPLEPINVLVGSNLLGLYLRRLLVGRGIDHINLRFYTPIQFAQKIVASTASAEWFDRPMLPAEGYYRVACRIARDLNVDSFFYPISEKPGFPLALQTSLSQVREAMLGHVLDIAADPSVEEIAQPKWLQYISLYNEYTTALDRFSDIVGLFNTASELSKQFCQSQKIDKLIIYGFYNLTPSQEALIKAINSSVKTLVFLPWCPSPAYTMVDELYSMYISLGFEHIRLDLSKDATPLAKLKDSLFTEHEGNIDGQQLEIADEVVAIHACPGTEREIKEILRRIVMLADSGESFNDMAILLRSSEPYMPIIIDLFKSAGIPIFSPSGDSVKTTPYGKGFSLLLNLAGSAYHRRAVCEFLSEAPLAFEFEPGEWVELIKQAGVVKGCKQWLSTLSALSENEAVDGRERYSPILSFLKKLFDDLESLPHHSSWSDYCNRLLKLSEEYFTNDTGYDQVKEILSDTSRLDIVESSVSLDDFKCSVTASIERVSGQLNSFQGGCVNVLPLMSARGLSFRTVFIPGMVEKVFPSIRVGDPLLTQSERELINNKARRRIFQKQTVVSGLEEMLLYSSAVSSARERLMLTYPSIEMISGKERTVSPFIIETASTILGYEVNSQELEKLTFFHRHRISELAPILPESAISQTEYDISIVSTNRANRAYIAALSTDAALCLDCDSQRWQVPKLTRWDGYIRPNAIAEGIQRFSLTKRTIAPTAIERFCSCPFRYFLYDILKIKPIEEPEEEKNITGSDLGSLVHSILHSFYLQLLQERLLPLVPSSTHRYKSVLREVSEPLFDKAESQGITGYGLLWELEKRQILENLDLYIENEAASGTEFTPALFEVDFGSNEDTPEFSLGSSVIRFNGRIDRIDIGSDNTARIIDYKTGRPKAKDNSLAGGTVFQLPIYAMASKAIAAQTGIEPTSISAYYYHIRWDCDYKKVGFTSAALEAKRLEISKILEWIERSITDGCFPFFPGKRKENCRYCPFAVVCGPNIDVIAEIKAEDTPYAELLTIRSIE